VPIVGNEDKKDWQMASEKKARNGSQNKSGVILRQWKSFSLNLLLPEA